MARDLTIADASQPVFALLYIAEAKGYLKEQRITVSFEKFTSGRDALASVINGQSDLATVFETPIVQRSTEGHALSVLTQLHSSSQNTGLVALRDRGIKSLRDLAGKKIAVPKGTNAEYLLELLLRSNSVNRSTVTVVDFPPEKIAEALADGIVDAGVLWSPHLIAARNRLSGSAETFFSDLYTEFSVLATTREYALKEGELLARVVEALTKAEQYMIDNQEESFRIVVDHLSDQSPESIRDALGKIHIELKLSNVLLTVMNQQARWYCERSGCEKPPPNLRQTLFTEALARIKPSSVTVL